MSEFRKVLVVSGKPGSIPEGCAYAWDISTNPPRRWYYNSAGIITEDTRLTSPLTANLAAGSNKITGLATGTDGNDAVNKAQMDAAITAASGGTWTTDNSATSNATFGTTPVVIQYNGDLVYIRQSLTNATGGTGSAVIDIDPIHADRRPPGTIYKPLPYWDDSASAWLTATLQINGDGTVDYYPPSGVTPGLNDKLELNLFYIS